MPRIKGQTLLGIATRIHITSRTKKRISSVLVLKTITAACDFVRSRAIACNPICAKFLTGPETALNVG